MTHEQGAADTAAGPLCPACDDGEERLVCSACKRPYWLVKFLSLDDYLRTLALLDTLAQFDRPRVRA